MSAIFGIYYLEGRPVDRTDLERMLESLAHRGPDGADLWSEGPVGLGHRMLWTTPESVHEKLPLLNHTRDLVLTADARIDNRDELLAVLGLGACPPAQVADSQLILAAYEKWGEHCPEKLLGDFAFALWDGRKQILFCARDHFGVKPFYYYSSESVFVFATEIKALLCLPAVPRRLNEVRVGEHLASMDGDTTITFYQDILRLPPRHSITVNHEGSQLQCYWSLDPLREVRLSSDEEYAEVFRELFTEAVRCRLRSALPMGSMLSGGLDSSSITCVARKLLAQRGDGRLHTFSAVFDTLAQCDERPYINAVLSQDSLEAHYLHADQVSPLTDLDRVLWHQDEAVSAGNLYINWCLYSRARQRGVRVLLDGFDGDTTVSHGDGYLVELARAGHWLTLAREVREGCRNLGRPWGGTLRNWVCRYGLNPMISKSRFLKQVRRIWRVLRRRNPIPFADRPEWSPILNPDFVRRTGLAERLKIRVDPAQTERQNHYRLLTCSVMPDTLEVMDRAASAFFVEVRFPFWDKRLAEFCLALPPEQKMHQGWTRMVLRRAMAGILPPEVQWRARKSNLQPSFDQGLLSFERERMDEVILKNPAIIKEYVDVPALREAYQRFVSREATEEEALAIWRAVSLALWMQRAALTS